ncbi:hypothetical protein [Fictibacillus phosphorivorans]|uniref:hypothetical protein n=1 Tax=Fictibacillus phosphorivorans TaxID=1221500 RepID=UPI00203ECD72|nr:hypothetical protein [Fictibacillus phosphorivorans]MCM3717664.1 hypothetical protein [Fictibacillus phosphorivorans]MCM3775564.1 hypothetical protein [Fictibacillus phosphorivorans]
MKIRLGVVGPQDSIHLVKDAAKEFHKIEIVPFAYQTIEETKEMIVENKAYVDQWFFSGQAPYYFALNNGLIREEEGSYVPLNGNSLYKTLLEAQVNEQKLLKKISLDTIQDQELEAIQQSIPALQISTFPYTGYMPAEDIVRFHRDLYNRGEIDVAITCIQAVYTKLKEFNIPCYRVTPDVPSIQLILQFLKERGESAWYKKAQTAILGIEVFHPSDMGSDQFYSYKMKHQELELQRLLLNYAETIRGSFVQIGDGHFYIYATRGEVELHLHDNSLLKLVEEAKLHSKLDVRIGLGYGFTAVEAEQNVRLAFQYARKQELPVIILVDEYKQVVEKSGVQENISYSSRICGDEWETRLKDASISPAIVSKIQSLSHYYKKTQITSQELAVWLKGTERNARRILSEMERLELVKVSGEEQSGNRGRPKKIYEFRCNLKAGSGQ